MGRPSIEPKILEFLREHGYASASSLAEGVRMNASHASTKLRQLARSGVVVYDEVARVYHLATDEEGRTLRLGVVAA